MDERRSRPCLRWFLVLSFVAFGATVLWARVPVERAEREAAIEAVLEAAGANCGAMDVAQWLHLPRGDLPWWVEWHPSTWFRREKFAFFGNPNDEEWMMMGLEGSERAILVRIVQRDNWTAYVALEGAPGTRDCRAAAVADLRAALPGLPVGVVEHPGPPG